MAVEVDDMAARAQSCQCTGAAAAAVAATICRRDAVRREVDESSRAALGRTDVS